MEEIDEELHDGSDLSNNHSQNFSYKKSKNERNYDYSDRGEASAHNLAESHETNPKFNESRNSQKLRKSKQSGSLRNEKVYYDTNNFNKNNNLKNKLNDENSNSERYLSEEISNSEEEINYKNNNTNYKGKNKSRKKNTSPQFYSKGNRKLSTKNEGSEKKNQNEVNSNRSRNNNNNNNNNRSSNPNDIESHLSSDKNTYYTFNEKYNNRKKENVVLPKNAKGKAETFNSREFNLSNKNINEFNNIKKSIQRYEESEEEKANNSQNDNDYSNNDENDKPKFNDINKEKLMNGNKFNKEKKGVESRNLKSKNSRSKDSSNSRNNSPLIIRKSIKFAAYGESFSVTESEKNSKKQGKIINNDYSEQDSLEENQG